MRIKKYNQEQERRDRERAEATQFRQSSFEALLNKMAL